MLADISANTRIHLAESLPRIEREKDEIVSRICASLARGSGDEDGALALARELIDCLIDQAGTAVDTGRFANLGAAHDAARHLQGAGYALPDVGDVLVPIVRDVLGTATGRSAAAAWSDTFWALFGKAESNSSWAVPVLEAMHASSAP
jgi:hypothetical protein